MLAVEWPQVFADLAFSAVGFGFGVIFGFWLRRGESSA